MAGDDRLEALAHTRGPRRARRDRRARGTATALAGTLATVGPGPTLTDLLVEVPLVVEHLLGIDVVDDATWQVTVEFDDRDGYARGIR